MRGRTEQRAMERINRKARVCRAPLFSCRRKRMAVSATRAEVIKSAVVVGRYKGVVALLIAFAILGTMVTILEEFEFDSTIVRWVTRAVFATASIGIMLLGTLFAREFTSVLHSRARQPRRSRTSLTSAGGAAASSGVSGATLARPTRQARFSFFRGSPGMMTGGPRLRTDGVGGLEMRSMVRRPLGPDERPFDGSLGAHGVDGAGQSRLNPLTLVAFGASDSSLPRSGSDRGVAGGGIQGTADSRVAGGAGTPADPGLVRFRNPQHFGTSESFPGNPAPLEPQTPMSRPAMFFAANTDGDDAAPTWHSLRSLFPNREALRATSHAGSALGGPAHAHGHAPHGQGEHGHGAGSLPGPARVLMDRAGSESGPDTRWGAEARRAGDVAADDGLDMTKEILAMHPAPSMPMGSPMLVGADADFADGRGGGDAFASPPRRPMGVVDVNDDPDAEDRARERSARSAGATRLVKDDSDEEGGPSTPSRPRPSDPVNRDRDDIGNRDVSPAMSASPAGSPRGRTRRTSGTRRGSRTLTSPGSSPSPAGFFASNSDSGPLPGTEAPESAVDQPRSEVHSVDWAPTPVSASVVGANSSTVVLDVVAPAAKPSTVPPARTTARSAPAPSTSSSSSSSSSASSATSSKGADFSALRDRVRRVLFSAILVSLLWLGAFTASEMLERLEPWVLFGYFWTLRVVELGAFCVVSYAVATANRAGQRCPTPALDFLFCCWCPCCPHQREVARRLERGLPTLQAARTAAKSASKGTSVAGSLGRSQRILRLNGLDTAGESTGPAGVGAVVELVATSSKADGAIGAASFASAGASAPSSTPSSTSTASASSSTTSSSSSSSSTVPPSTVTSSSYNPASMTTVANPLAFPGTRGGNTISVSNPLASLRDHASPAASGVSGPRVPSRSTSPTAGSSGGGFGHVRRTSLRGSAATNIQTAGSRATGLSVDVATSSASAGSPSPPLSPGHSASITSPRAPVLSGASRPSTASSGSAGPRPRAPSEGRDDVDRFSDTDEEGGRDEDEDDDERGRQDEGEDDAVEEARSGEDEEGDEGEEGGGEEDEEIEVEGRARATSRLGPLPTFARRRHPGGAEAASFKLSVEDRAMSIGVDADTGFDLTRSPSELRTRRATVGDLGTLRDIAAMMGGDDAAKGTGESTSPNRGVNARVLTAREGPTPRRTRRASGSGAGKGGGGRKLNWDTGGEE